MKGLKLLLVSVIFCGLLGCQAEDQNLNEIIKTVIHDSLGQEIPSFTNLNKEYYRFYLPSDVGRKSSDEVSNILFYNNRYLVMCVNIPNVLKDQFYAQDDLGIAGSSPTFSSEVEIQEFAGTYVDYGNITVDYQVVVMTIQKDLYFLQVTTRYLSFGAVVSKIEIGEMLSKILAIARTVRINYELIALNFSNREVSPNALQALDLFAEKAPTDGKIIDLINPQGNNKQEKSEDQTEEEKTEENTEEKTPEKKKT